MKRLALAILVVGMASAYSWQWVPFDVAGEAWNIATHLQSLWLLVVVAALARDLRVTMACALVAAWQVLPAGCSAWWLFDPWPVSPNDERCSTRLGIPLGVIGLAACAWLAGEIYRGKGHHEP